MSVSQTDLSAGSGRIAIETQPDLPTPPPPPPPPHHYFYSIHRCMHALVSCRPGAGQAQMVVSCITQGCVRALKVCLQGLSNSQWTCPKKHREAERTPSACAKSPFLPPFPPKFTPHNPAPAHQDQSLDSGRLAGDGSDGSDGRTDDSSSVKYNEREHRRS